MKSKAINKKKRQATKSEQGVLRLPAVIRENLYAFVIHEGLKALNEVLERDREELCGTRYTKGRAGDPLRWGSSEGRLVMGGRRVIVRKPRVRMNGKEVTLPAWAQFEDEDPLTERTVEQMVLGVSTRSYNRSLEELPNELEPHGASKSAASRRFVEATKDKLSRWLERGLSKLDISAVMLDGIKVGEQTVIVALGIDESGKKHPLGLWLGVTENSTVCEHLLNNLVERGLDPQKSCLFIIDGSKALRKAIREIFGKRSLVQRCQEHKRRNVLAHLPKRLHPSTNRMLRAAYMSTSKATAKKRLLQVIAHLRDDYPDAAESLREGLDETLSLKDLKLSRWLEQILSTTNLIENLNGGIRRVTRNVKRWRDGRMIRRWVAIGILETQSGFRRIRDYKAMPMLVEALRQHAERINRIDEKEQAA